MLGSRLFNVHLLAIPMFESHTGLNMFNLLKKAMDALCVGWEKKIIGYTSDGASNMTGCVQGLGTRIEQEASEGFYCVWCAAHQLDLVVQDVLNSMYNEEFVSTIQLLTGHLRRQKNLIRDMKATCPRFISTRWLSMGRLLSWLKDRRRDVLVHLNTKKPACEPKSDWWITVSVLEHVMKFCNKYMTELQGKQLLLAQQKQVLERLREHLMRIGHVQNTMLSMVNSNDMAQAGGFSMSFQSAKTFVLNLGDLHVISLHQALERENPDAFKELNRSVACMFVRLVHGIFILSPERNSLNQPSSDMPPCQPHSVAVMGAFAFSNIVREQMERLEHSFHADYAQELMAEFKDFEEKYQSDRGFRSIVDNTKDRTATFYANWNSFQPSFPKLVQFCGGLASVFPGTSTVESDFSVIGWEKDEYRFNLTDLSLEGILHAKQTETLAEIEAILDKLEC